MLDDIHVYADTLKVGVRRIPSEFYQIVYHNFSYDLILRNVYETLFKLDNNYSIQPVLATEWKNSDDNRVWTIKIRKNASFSNGQSLSANDVKTSFDWMMEQAKLRKNQYILNLFDKLEIIDNFVIKLITKYPNANTLAILSKYMPIFLTVKKPFDTFQNIPLGTGPYTLQKDKSQVSLKKQSNGYWGPEPFYDAIVFKIREEAASKMALLSGDIDVSTDISYEFYQDIERSSNHYLVVQNSKVSYVAINTHIKPFNDIRIRKALNLAIDRAAINKHIFHENAVINRGFFSPLTIGSNPDISPYKYNPDQAIRLLKDAGVYGNLRIRLNFPLNNIARKQAELISEFLKMINISIKLIPLNIGEWYAKYQKPDNKGLFFVETNFNPLPVFYYAGPFRENIIKEYYFNYTELKSKFKKAISTFDTKERKRMYYEIDSKIHADCLFIFLHTYPSSFIGISDQVNNQAWLTLTSAGLNSCDNCYNDPKCKEREDCAKRCCPD